jgi:hypothetical protein
MSSVLNKSVAACFALHVAVLLWAQTLSQTVA